jgi:hypothetical protein
MVKKARSPFVNEGRDPKTNISTENHMQMFDKLMAAHKAGIHGKPGNPKPKKGS